MGPRRIVALLLVAAGLTALWSGAPALAPAALGGDDAPAAVPMPRRGDELVYEFRVWRSEQHHVDGGAAFEGEDTFVLGFRFDGERAVPGPMGTSVRGEHVSGRVLHESREPGIMNLTFPLGEARPFFFEQDVEYLSAYDPTSAVPVAHGELYESAMLLGSHTRSYEMMSPWTCLLRAHWQGQPADAFAGRLYTDACPTANEYGWVFNMRISDYAPFDTLWAFPGVALEPRGWERIGDLDAFGLDAEIAWGSSHPSADWSITTGHTWWLSHDVPYPLRFEVRESGGSTRGTPGGAGEWRTESTLVATLVGYRPGDEPLSDGPADRRAPERRAGVTIASFTHGPAAGTGIVPAMPLEDAVARALGDPALREFRAWLESNPEAQLQSGTYLDDASMARDLEWGYGARVPAQGRERGWALAWGVPSGEIYRVEVYEPRGARAGDVPLELPASASYAIERGAHVGGHYEPGSLPREGITFADAARIYLETVPGSRPEDIRSFTFDLARDRIGANTDVVLVGEPLPLQRTPGYHEVVFASLATGGLGMWISFDGEVAWTPGPSEGTIALPPPRGAADTDGWPDLIARAAMATGVLAVLALVAYVVHTWFPRLVLAPLYTRLSGDLLRNPARRALFDLIRAEPGVHMSELARRSSLGNGALAYHLEVLRRGGHVARVDAGRYARWFTSGTLSASEMARQAELLAGSAARVHEILRGSPGISQRELARRLGVSEPTVHEIVSRLEAAGLVMRERRGRSMAIFAR